MTGSRTIFALELIMLDMWLVSIKAGSISLFKANNRNSIKMWEICYTALLSLLIVLIRFNVLFWSFHS